MVGLLVYINTDSYVIFTYNMTRAATIIIFFMIFAFVHEN
jgi:hypothetical protein